MQKQAKASRGVDNTPTTTSVKMSADKLASLRSSLTDVNKRLKGSMSPSALTTLRAKRDSIKLKIRNR